MQLELRSIEKSFGDTKVLHGIDMKIKSGQMVTLLGHSGCGKTTLLRILSGLVTQDGGKILFDGAEVQDQPTHLRGTAMVFQSYAIFPHLTVGENVTYGLVAQKMRAQDRKKRAKEMLEKVQLGGYEDRKPAQLSGGQKQRVGLARALAVRPKILLMDEPLSNLDASLRIEMREEIRLLQREYGMTTVYVTHDQEEALAVSDKVALMSGGYIRQFGTPIDLYSTPKDVTVAEFIGRSNIVGARIAKDTSGPCIMVGEDRLGGAELLPKNADTSDIKIGFRPEADVTLTEESQSGGAGVFCQLVLASFVGAKAQLRLKLRSGQEIELHVDASHPSLHAANGSGWRLTLRANAVHLFDATGAAMETDQ